jgi:signal peptidase I
MNQVLDLCRRLAMWSGLVGMSAGLIVASCAANDVAMKRSGLHGRLAGAGARYRESGGAMEPTLSIGTRVITRHGVPVVGDVVVLRPPIGAPRELCGHRRRVLMRGGAACDIPGASEGSLDIVSRIVAGPGDEMYVRGGRVFRRGRGGQGFLRERASYATACGDAAACNLPVPITIPAGHWFVMGDHRDAADDGRWSGPVPTKWIVGIATSLECLKRSVRPRVWVRRTVEQGCAGVRARI